MRKLPPRLFGALAAMMAMAGCATPCARHSSVASCANCACPIDLPASGRSSVESNIRTLPGLPKQDGAPAPEQLPAASYRALTAKQVQCLAVAATVPAKLQDAEIGLVPIAWQPGAKERGVALRQAVLIYSALELRNRSAGSALELYYRLAEAEGKAELLGQGIGHLERSVRETRDMMAQRLKPPVALDIWTRQLLTAQSDLTQADMAITQLNGELRRLLGLANCGDSWRISNPEPYDVTDVAIDVDAAVAEGLARRPELLLLRTLIHELSVESLPAARDLLRSVNPLLGAASHPGAHVLAKLAILSLKGGDHAEVEVRRRQLQEYLCEREAAVADEIRQAVASVRSHARLVALSAAREQSWEDKLKEVKARQQQGLAPSAEVTQTTLEMLKARADVIQEVMAWYIAGAKLRQAQGLLVAECDSGLYCR